MQFEPLVGNAWSVPTGDHYRALAQKHGDVVVWFWIGTHEDYNNVVRQLRYFLNYWGTILPEQPIEVETLTLWVTSDK
jgi:hypothetical protein